jgi:hypothetical protein
MVMEPVELVELVVWPEWVRCLHAASGLELPALGEMVLGEASSLVKSCEAAIAASGEDTQCRLHVLTIGSNVEARWLASLVWCVAVEIDDMAPRSRSRAVDDGLGRPALRSFSSELPKLAAPPVPEVSS